MTYSAYPKPKLIRAIQQTYALLFVFFFSHVTNSTPYSKNKKK